MTEGDSRRAFNVVCDALKLPPWEKLSNRQISAFKELVEDFEQDPSCCNCGGPLYCIDCDPELLECVFCGESLTCPICDTTTEEDKSQWLQGLAHGRQDGN